MSVRFFLPESCVRVLSTLTLLVFLSACDTTAVETRPMTEQPITDQSPLPMRVRSELLVKFKPEVPPERIGAILKDTKAELITVFKGTGIHHVRIVGGESLESVITTLSSYPEVEYAEPNYVQHLQDPSQ
jgi:fervidolysin-like protein